MTMTFSPSSFSYALLLLHSLVLLHPRVVVRALDPDCQPDGADPYTGYSLKLGSGCQQYVYCTGGTISSWLLCTSGLLFNGGVGRGGICDWAGSVRCEETTTATTATTTATTATTTTGAAAAAAAAVVPPPAPVFLRPPAPVFLRPPAPAAIVDNPEGYFCGLSESDAAAICKPCPSGGMIECGDDFAHGCFRGISSCLAATSSAAGADEGAGGTAVAVRPSPSSSSPSPSPSLPPYTMAPFAPSPSYEKRKTVIGYYASWQWYDRNKLADPANVDFAKYTRINYAFFQPDTEGNLYGTDEWADPQLLFGPYLHDAAAHAEDNRRCSWDRPGVRNCNHHDLSRGLLHLAKSRGVEVWPSIGGWTLSDNFPGIAASPELRDHFAQQCVDLLTHYGFDGIDIDWEYPGYEDHSGTPADTENFTLLLRAVRAKLDALGGGYGLTAALPCGPDKIEDIQVPEIDEYLTEFNLMSYDMHGAWDALTGTNAPMSDQGWGDKTRNWSTHGCVDTYHRDHGIPLSKINIGLPFYGRSFRGATGMKQFHGGADDINYHLDEGSPQYFNIVNELGRMTSYRHEATRTQYAVFNDGDRGLVSYDDARAICDKVHYANQRGLHGFLVWEISGDMIDMGDGKISTPLIDAANAKISNPNMDCAALGDPDMGQASLIAPDEPDTVDWSNYVAPVSEGSANDFNGAQEGGGQETIPAPADSESLPSFTAPAASSYSLTSTGGEACPLEHTGYYPTARCDAYVYCAEGKMVGAVLPCVPGTLFDVTIGVCTWADAVQCGS